MTVASSFQFSHDLGIHWNQRFCKQFEIQGPMERGKLHSLSLNPSSYTSCRDSWRVHLSNRGYVPLNCVRYKCNVFKCHSSLVSGKSFRIFMKPSVTALTRSYDALQGCPLVVKIVPALGIIIFAVCGLGPLLRQVRKFLFHKSDSSWQKSGTYHVTISYLRPLMVWAGLILICREFDSLIPPSEAAEVVKLRLLNFVRSFSTVMAFAYCLSSVIQHAQKFFLETNDSSDARKMGFHFAGKAVYSAVWVAAVSLFMELLGFSTQRWLTAGGLGTVLLTLAGREIFTNFLSSVMIHATRPFVLNEWIQTKIEGYEVSGTVEHVGWWSPTIIRGEDREAVHIPNHKFTMNVVRNLSQKTHWRIKTHLAVSHLDVSKINNIVADMRKVLAKNPQVEQQRLHRRVFLDRVHHENQALLVLISCFVKTSHFEEYLCVKETIILDLLRVMTHHRARLATPIRTVQKMYYDDMNMENIPFADTVITYGAAASPLNRPFLLGEPPHKINGGDKVRSNNGGDPKSSSKETVSDSNKGDAKSGAKSDSGKAPKVKLASKSQSEVEMPHSDGSFQKQSKQDVKMDEADTLKQETEKPHRSASMEENIVLGVALEGSKRTLPIEEEDV